MMERNNTHWRSILTDSFEDDNASQLKTMKFDLIIPKMLEPIISKIRTGDHVGDI